MGIKGNHAAIRINFQVTNDEQQRIARALVHLSRTISKQHCKEFVQGDRQLLPVELKLNGKASWDPTLASTNGRDADLDLGMRDWKMDDTHSSDGRTSTYFQNVHMSNIVHARHSKQQI